MRKNYNMKKTISIKKFISELGDNFSEHMKKRLLDLEIRTVLTRKEENILDIKHVEHTKYDCNTLSSSDDCEKEYTYGQLLVVDGNLYFSESCIEDEKVMASPVIDKIFNALSPSGMITHSDIRAKLIHDSNIDFIIDSILEACPPVSQAYLDIVKQMTSLSNR